jgi:hypothetical protein
VMDGIGGEEVMMIYSIADKKIRRILCNNKNKVNICHREYCNV